MSTLTAEERATSPASSPQHTVVTVSAGSPGGRARVGLHVRGASTGPVLRPILLASHSTSARVALVPEGALLLAGDAIAIDIEIGAGLSLELVEPAGTVAYDMRGAQATWDVHVELGADARLIWHGEPFVVAAGARVRRTTSVVLGEGAALALRDTLVLGRHGEAPGAIVQATEMTDASGEPRLVEELELDPHRAAMALGRHRVLDTLLVIGAELPAVLEADRLELERGGTVLRRLAHDAHGGLTKAHWHAAASCLVG